MNRRFYDSDRSYVKNLMAVDHKDPHPNHFSRLMILRWLFGKFSQQGGAGMKGYFPIKLLIDELTLYGLEPSIIRRETEYLTKAYCIVTEDFRDEGLTDDDLIRLAPAGFVHLDLMTSVTYLAAIAEDTWFYSEGPPRRIAERIQNLQNQYNADIAVANARDVLAFLEEERTRAITSTNAIIDRGTYEQLSDISALPDAINALERSLTTPSWAAAYTRFPAKSNTTGTVVNVKDFGVFVELEPGISGLIHASRLPLGFKTLEQFSYGERIIVEIQSVNAIKKRIDMSYVGLAQEEHLTDIEQMTLEMFPSDDTEPPH
jgi:hypothetical protein